MVYLRILFHNAIKGKAYKVILICKATAMGLANASTPLQYVFYSALLHDNSTIPKLTEVHG